MVVVVVVGVGFVVVVVVGMVVVVVVELVVVEVVGATGQPASLAAGVE
jgi:hypothetical protein